MLPILDPDSYVFPDVSDALDAPSGLLAVGGDLHPERIIAAYRHGIFPWYEEGQPILWWSPDPRMVLFPSELHISKSLAKVLKKTNISITIDKAFDQVISACAGERAYASGTWITQNMKTAYTKLHHLSYAHSIEAWQEGELIGGLYGLAMGKVFYGESMFSIQENASKIAFVQLVKQLELWGYELIDCQIASSYLASFGAREISRIEFLKFLQGDSETASQIPFNPV
jgi:leucyl/phenylalanyl-tRNA---protein transferase